MLKEPVAAGRVLVSEGFFDAVLNDTMTLVNEEFRKLRIRPITRDDLTLFFTDATAGISVRVQTTESRKKILTSRLVKIANRISEDHSINGFMLRVD